MQTSAEWKTLVDRFKSFGGQVKNITQQEGPLGLGLFPIKLDEKFNLIVPRHLLIPADNVELKGDEIHIKNQNNFPEGYSEWFTHYQSTFSWGAEGEVSVTRFEKSLQALPASVQFELIKLGLYQPDQRLPKLNYRENMLRRFLNCRCLRRNGQLLIMPILELVNHSPLAENWETDANGNVGVSGNQEGEIFVKYSNADPLRRLMGFGFNCREQMAFSLDISVQHRGQTVTVLGGGGRYWFQPPKIQSSVGSMVIRQPLLGFSQGPKLAKSLFLKACQNLTNVDACELFEQIHRANILALVNLLRLLDKQTGEMVCQLRCGCLDQLLVLSDHIGYRPELIQTDKRFLESGEASLLK